MTTHRRRWMTELAIRAAEHVNEYEVFRQDVAFVDAAGRVHSPILYEKPVTIEEAFNEITASNWAHALGLPVAPTLFNYKKNADDEWQPLIISVQLHAHAVRVETVLEHAEAAGKKKKFKSHSHDGDIWLDVMHGITPPPLMDLETQVFRYTRGAISRMMPFAEWIGGGDLNTSNQILDTGRALALLRDGGLRSGQDLGIYFCDFAVNPLQVDFTSDTPAITHPDDIRDHYGCLAEVLASYPTLNALEAKMARATRAAYPEQNAQHKAHFWFEMDEQYPDKLVNPVFAPQLDFVGMRKTAQHIQSFSDAHIRYEMKRLAKRMNGIIRDAETRTRLTRYADYMAEVFIIRKHLLRDLIKPFTEHEHSPLAASKQPFQVLSDAVHDETLALRKNARAKRPPKRPTAHPAQHRAKPKKKDLE